MEKNIKITLQFQDQATAMLSSTVAKLQTTFGALTTGVTKTFGGILSTVGGAIKGVIGWLGGLVSRTRWASLFVGSALLKIGKDALDMAAQVEQSRVAFETLLKSPEKAGGLLEWITQLSIKTPFTRQEINSLAQTTLAYGRNLEETKRSIMAVVETTSALGISETRLNAITYNLGQINASTTVSYRELRDLQKQGVGTAKLLANAVNDGAIKLSGFGKVAGDSARALITLTREQEEQILKMNTGKQIAAALEEQMIKTYGGASMKQVKTLSGIMSNFSDVYQYVVQRAMGISLQGEVIVGGAFDKIRGAAAKAIEFLLGNIDKISEFFNKIISNSENLKTIFIFMLAAFGSFIIGIVGPALILGGIITVLVRLVDSLANKFGGLSSIINNAKDTWSTFSDFIVNVFWPAIMRFVDVVAPPFIEAWQQLKPALIEFWEALKPLLPTLGMIIGMFLAIIAALMTGLMTALAKVLPYLTNILTAIVTLINEVITFIVALFTGNLEMLRNSWYNIWTSIYNILANTLNGIIAFVKGFITGIINFFVGLYEALVGKSVIWDIVNGMIDAFSLLKEKSLALISSLVGGIRDKFMGIVDAAKSWGSGIINNFVEGLRGQIKAAGAASSWLIGKLGVPFELIKQHGGIVPGPVGAPMPVVAHGGERILPRGSNTESPFAGGMGGVSININGSISMDSEERVRELARTIMRMLSRESELGRYGVGY